MNKKVRIPSLFSAIKKLASMLSRQEKFTWSAIGVFALVVSFLELFTAAIIVVFAQVLNHPEIGKTYLSRLGLDQTPSDNRIVFYFALFVGAVYLVKNFVAAAEVFFQNFSIQRMNYHFKNNLLHRYAEIDYNFYLTRNSSLGLQVVSGDVEQMFSVAMVSIAGIFSEGLIFFCLLAMVIYMNPSLAVLILALGVSMSWIIMKFLLPLFYRWGQKLQFASLSCTKYLMQFFHAFKEIILLGKKDAFVDAYKFHAYKKSRAQALQTTTNALPRIVLEMLFVGLFVFSIAFLCLKKSDSTQMIGILGGYLYVGFRLMPGLNRMINQMNTLKMVIPSVERVHSEFNTICKARGYVHVPQFQFEKNICINHMFFRYLGAQQDALRDLSLEIRKQECIGIAGETGSGKSTLVDIILGLLQPTQGTILIDGKFPTNAYEWHQKIGYVPQNVYLIDDSIAANIAFGENKIDVDRLQKTIEAAQLKNFIAQLPNGLQTIVGERGMRLSGGERQRIAIARALYRDPEVLIFDEATSALDMETEARLMETIHAVSKGCTVIMIAHRLSTLKECQRIVLMEEGRISRICSYSELGN